MSGGFSEMTEKQMKVLRAFEKKANLIRQRSSLIVIGDYVRLNGKIDMHYPHVTIGDYVNLGGDSFVITHCPVRGMKDFMTVIEHDTFIGYGCLILPGIRIGSRCLIGAGSVVSRDIPADSVACGNPAKVVGTRDGIEIVRTHLITKQGLTTGVPGKEPDWKELTILELEAIFDNNKERILDIRKKLKGEGYVNL